jgi:VIT1/CCC1 family predicted Fe2+/Mn2+ transporter
MAKSFYDLSEKDILALAISLEEEDGRIYGEFAERMRPMYMGFAEALSDDGALSGRGQPWLRGTACGAMTTVGGIGHTLPYLIPSFYYATGVAVVIVAIELSVISWIRHHYMDTPLLSAIFQVVLGGVLVFLTGILIGSA